MALAPSCEPLSGGCPERGDSASDAWCCLWSPCSWSADKKLRYLEYLGRDPLVQRIAGLHRPPSRRTLARCLADLRKADMDELDRLVLASATDPIKPLSPSRLTIDVDGGVLTTGLTVAGAERVQPARPQESHLLATLAQAGPVLADRNRPGNVHDSHRQAAFSGPWSPAASGAPYRGDNRGTS